jgi:hypothetical protein
LFHKAEHFSICKISKLKCLLHSSFEMHYTSHAVVWLASAQAQAQFTCAVNAEADV